MLHTKFLGHRPFGSGEDLLRFLPYMGMVASWSCDHDRLKELSFTRPIEPPHKIWFQLAQWLLKRYLKMLTNGRRTTDDGCLPTL